MEELYLGSFLSVIALFLVEVGTANGTIEACGLFLRWRARRVRRRSVLIWLPVLLAWLAVDILLFRYDFLVFFVVAST